MRPASTTFRSWLSAGDATTTRWHRTDGLALPTGGAELAVTGEQALGDVHAFLDRLIELPLPKWLAIGSELMADRQGLSCRQAAWSGVEAAIADLGLGLRAWYTREAVETIAFLVSRRVSRWSHNERCRFAATHGAADAAALSLLVQPHIPAGTLRILCEPFVARC